MKKTISKLLIENSYSEYVSFRAPGHKGRLDQFELAGYADIYGDVIKNDITAFVTPDSVEELRAGTKEIKLNYASMYGANQTELLVGSCDMGVTASVLSTVPHGGKLILARNSQQAAFSALRLGEIEPIYLRPEIDNRYGIQSSITAVEVADACDAYPDASAVLITSPNCFGILSDIRAISHIVHDHNMILIVDQSHGAHLTFFDMEYETYGKEAGSYRPRRQASENLGADIVINGISETLFSLSSSGIMNICTDRVFADDVAEKLKSLQAVNPSFVQLASLDINESIMRHWGIELTHAWKRDIEWFYGQASMIKGLTLASPDRFMDYTKLNISMAKYGVKGEKLDRELRKRGIAGELVHGDYVLLVTGAGNRRDDYEKLVQALKEISELSSFGNDAIGIPTSFDDFVLGVTDVPTKREAVPLFRADGRVAYDPIIVYPPGMPIACPGEILDGDVITFMARAVARGDKISGVDDEGCIYVGLE